MFLLLFIGVNLFNPSTLLAYTDPDDYLITIKGAKVIAKNEIEKEKLRSASKAVAERLAAKYQSAGLDVTIYPISETSHNVALTNPPSFSDQRSIALYISRKVASAVSPEEKERAENMSEPEAMYGLALQKQEDHERRMRRGSQMQNPKQNEAVNATSSSEALDSDVTIVRYIQPLHASDIPVTELSLKNGRKIRCYILQKDEKGMWVEPVGLEGGKMYFSNNEIYQQDSA